jgi:hypothetical protein
MADLNGLATRARRFGHRVVLDVRLHGLVETAQLRGFEMISNIARRAVKRYDGQDRQSSGRRDIAAMICHYAEQRLERMRGTLGPGETRDRGYYESTVPTRYQDALDDEVRSSPRSSRRRTCRVRTRPPCRSDSSPRSEPSLNKQKTSSGASAPTTARRVRCWLGHQAFTELRPVRAARTRRRSEGRGPTQAGPSQRAIPCPSRPPIRSRAFQSYGALRGSR